LPGRLDRLAHRANDIHDRLPATCVTMPAPDPADVPREACGSPPLE
jgi:hypothetical protein